jgi:hypothetical protein
MREVVKHSSTIWKAAVNTPQSRRSAKFEDARQARSVWSSARGFSTAFGWGEEFNATALAEIRLVALESDLSRRNQATADGVLALKFVASWA